MYLLSLTFRSVIGPFRATVFHGIFSNRGSALVALNALTGLPEEQIIIDVYRRRMYAQIC